MNSAGKSALSYVFGWVSGLIFLIIEKNDYFVRRNAAQSFTLGILMLIIRNVFNFTHLSRSITFSAILIVYIVLKIILIIKALSYEFFYIPILSDISDKYVSKWFRQ